MRDKDQESSASSGIGWKGCLSLAVFGPACALYLLLSTCVSRVLVTRTASPDGSLIASVTETNGGAITDFGYEVDVARNRPVRWSHRVAGFYGAGRSDCAYGVKVSWIANDTLLISYKDAKYADADRAAHLLGRTVRVITKSGINDRAAPCGGMEYSQHGQIWNGS